MRIVNNSGILLLFQHFCDIIINECGDDYMGYAKYHEDDYHIYCDRIFTNGLILQEKIKQRIVHHRCPYCDTIFDEKELMFSHIRHNHNITGPLLFVNGIVVKGKDTVYVSDIQSVLVEMYGFNKEISVNGVIIPANAENDSIDISNLAKDAIDKKNNCIITLGDISAKIEKYSLYAINQDVLNHFIFEWENIIKNGATFKPFNYYITDLNDAELYYLNGIYNYFVACQAQNNDKIERYYEANSILKKFIPSNSLGLCIQKIIAFKFNWVNTLEELCKTYGTVDDFISICHFFNNSHYDYDLTNNNHTKTIFMEDELQEVFLAIIAFIKKDYSFVNDFLCSHEVDTITDLNLKDKVLLLKSKMLLLNGNNEEAEFYLNEIRTDEFK